jgi:mono/diheme cytochrome c family protein
MRFLWGIVFGILLVAAAAVAGFSTGVFNTAATVQPGELEKRIAALALERSIQRRAPKVANPLKPDPEVLRGGMAHYREMCVTCHGAPGVDASEAGEGLNPPAPDLTLGRVQKRTDGELFWLVQNGVRMTGMPAFGPSHKDEEIWQIVAFLRHLPALTPDETTELRGAELPHH